MNACEARKKSLSILNDPLYPVNVCIAGAASIGKTYTMAISLEPKMIACLVNEGYGVTTHSTYGGMRYKISWGDDNNDGK